jgi:hypothetical protein
MKNAEVGKGPLTDERGMAKGPSARGEIAGTHYDPESANANRAQTKRRPAPVNSLVVAHRG